MQTPYSWGGPGAKGATTQTSSQAAEIPGESLPIPYMDETSYQTMREASCLMDLAIGNIRRVVECTATDEAVDGALDAAMNQAQERSLRCGPLEEV